MSSVPDRSQVDRDAERVIETIKAGGIAIIPLDVAYAILGHGEAAIRRIFQVKQRSYEKPSGMICSAALSREVHLLDQRAHDIVRAVTQDHDLPFSIVAPFRHDHPVFADLDPFVLESSTKQGTLDMLMNAGVLHNAVAGLSLERLFAVFGSSANLSLTGSKFRLQDVDAPLREAATLAVDYGLCKYHNPQGVSSTIVDLRNFAVVRHGCCFEQIAAVFQKDFGIELEPDRQVERRLGNER